MSNKEADWGLRIVLCAVFIWPLGQLIYYIHRDMADERMNERLMDYTRGKIYCKECKRNEYIEVSSVRFQQHTKDCDWYYATIKTNRHKEEPFVFSFTVSKRSGAIGGFSLEEGPGADY